MKKFPFLTFKDFRRFMDPKRPLWLLVILYPFALLIFYFIFLLLIELFKKLEEDKRFPSHKYRKVIKQNWLGFEYTEYHER